MIKTFIKCISFHLPQNEVTNDYLSTLSPNWTSDKIYSKIGIERRFITNENEFASDIAVKSANKLFVDNNIDPNEIDFLIYCTQSPDYLLPTTACIIQNTLGLKKSIGAIDFNLGCSGYVYGLSIAKGLIQSGSAKNVLLITSETYSKFLKSDDISNRSIFGDAATSTLISTSGIAEIKDFVFGTDGSGAKNLNLKYGGIKYNNNFNYNNKNEDDFGSGNSNENYLYMNGAEIFSFTLFSIPEIVQNILKKNNITFNEIDYFVFHQASKMVLDALRKKININEDKFFTNIKNYGNTVSSTIPIALSDLTKQSNDLSNKKILITGFGVGYSWSGTILQF